ncbi:hypothetical protein TCAL_04506 [Tigriopus californicus]|uniref:Mitochondrial glycine transporter n=1 Tax=Tigriopus californicus TaxID=6832 RepID=A0A553PD83_TIGCA|nr:mitochondrial glycine transporter A-like [Tigriopus californicus]XP_059099465.1 mitochondrial glycine transporter A-like [Tigriopus californicus]TRY75636.1 hypothetical protein TCAL_04506 [Tigriopus californicus]|eukprot:TCALIF_04506-PA protein Name:"Similar to Slc25a38 Solute carrier family 25 member 38 (Rattus norvegicus)" AED:0.34 eAED:0.34 QI:0/-1/0/1/-1/1/1/0/344
MSHRLIPFSLVLTSTPHQTDPQARFFSEVIPPLKAKMDIATNPVMKSFLAGSLSGTFSTILFQPLDLVKTRIQNHHQYATANHALASSATSGGRLVHSLSMFSVVRQVLKSEHITGLWRGIIPSVTRTVPGVGLYFSSLHWLKTHVANGNDKPSPLQAIALGMTARCIAGTLVIPITVIKTRFESGTYQYKKMSQAFVQIYAREGVRGLCCGLIPTLVRDAPFSGLYLMFYTQLKQQVIPRLALSGPDNGPINGSKAALSHFSCGILAGFFASMVTHPADVVKTKMQLDPKRFNSVSITLQQILRTSGPRGLMVGLAPRMLRRTLMSALAWTVYEEIMRQVGLK